MKRFLAVLLVAVMLMSILPATSMAASYATVVGGWLRLRSAPNFNATTITSYYTGTQVQIISSSGGWYKVQTPDGRIGYMYGDYLRVGGSIPSEGTAYVTSYNGYGVRLRTGPGTGYRIIRTYAVGTPVTVLERGTYWSRISIGGTVGYMMSQFLHFGSDYPDDGNVLCYATIWSSNGYGVRLRTGPSKSYSKIGVYSVGTKVAVLQKGAVWDRIRVGSRVGWMMNEFLIYHENNEITSVTLNNYMPVVGSVLSMQAVAPNTATVSYEWLVGGVLKSTNTTYTVDANDVGKTIQLRVTGTGSYKGTVTSAATNAVVSNTVLTGVTLNTIAPVVGDVMTATINPAGASVIYAWKVGGYQVSNAATYTVTANDVGKQIELIVTGTGVYSGTKSSGLTAAVSASRAIADVVIRNDSNPTVGAAPSVGDKLTAVPSPAQATVTYQWNRDGAAISGATAASYTVAAEDQGHKLSVTVTGTGSYTGTDTSSQTATVVVKAPLLGIVVPTFDEVVVGYEQPAAKALTITNTGSATANITSVNSDSSDFVITEGNKQIAVGATDTSWTIQPVSGLSAGTYTGQITVTYNGAAPATARVTLTVSEGSAPAEATLSVDGATVTQTVGKLENIPITIRNTSAFDAAIRQVAINDTNNYFTVNGDGSSKIPANQSDASYWYVTPKADLPAGPYSTKVTVTYNSGEGTSDHTAEATITLNVSGSAPAPQALSVTLSFEEGSENMTVGQRIKLTANATGGDGSYQYSWDGGGTYVDASTWSYELVDGDAAKSPLSLWVIVQDGSGATATSNSITISVTNPSASTLDLLPSDNNMDTLQEEPAVSQTQTYTEPVQETYTEPAQEPVAEPEPQAPAAAVLTIQSKSSVTKGKTLQLTALMNDQAIVYDSNNDEAYPILWTLSGAKSKGTSISASGLLTVAADETATSLTLTATLKSDANNFSTMNLQVKEAQTTETVNTTETVVNDDGTNDAGMELLDTLLNP